jgi:hypothetical protein
MEKFKNADCIDEHPFWKILLRNSLNFDVNQQNQLFSLFKLNLDELVGKTFPNFCIRCDFLELGVEKFDRFRPINQMGDRREKEFDRFSKVLTEKEVNLSERVTPFAWLQNRACRFHCTRLLNNGMYVRHTSPLGFD